MANLCCIIFWKLQEVEWMMLDDVSVFILYTLFLKTITWKQTWKKGFHLN